MASEDESYEDFTTLSCSTVGCDMCVITGKTGYRCENCGRYHCEACCDSGFFDECGDFVFCKGCISLVNDRDLKEYNPEWWKKEKKRREREKVASTTTTTTATTKKKNKRAEVDFDRCGDDDDYIDSEAVSSPPLPSKKFKGNDGGQVPFVPPDVPTKFPASYVSKIGRWTVYGILASHLDPKTWVVEYYFVGVDGKSGLCREKFPVVCGQTGTVKEAWTFWATAKKLTHETARGGGGE